VFLSQSQVSILLYIQLGTFSGAGATYTPHNRCLGTPRHPAASSAAPQGLLVVSEALATPSSSLRMPAIVCDRDKAEGVPLDGVRDEAGARHGIKDRQLKRIAHLVGVGWELGALTENAANRHIRGRKLLNLLLDFFHNVFFGLVQVNRRALLHMFSEAIDLLEAKHFDFIFRRIVRELLELFFEGSSVRREHEHNFFLGNHLHDRWEQCQGRHEARRAGSRRDVCDDTGDHILNAVIKSTVSHNNLDFARDKRLHGSLQTFIDLFRAVDVFGFSVRFCRLDRSLSCNATRAEILIRVNELVRKCIAGLGAVGNDLTMLNKGLAIEPSLDHVERQPFRSMEEAPETRYKTSGVHHGPRDQRSETRQHQAKHAGVRAEAEQQSKEER